MINKTFATIFVFVISTSYAVAQIDYCELSERSIELNYFSHSYKEKNQLGPILNYSSEIIKSMQIGDEIIINRHKNGAFRTVKVCKPGCPKKDFLSSILNSTCSTQVAKKDLIEFNQVIKRELKNIVGSVNKKFNIYVDFQSLNSIKDNESGKETLVFHSFVPYEVDINDKASFDKFFVRSIQSQDLSSVNIPMLTYEGKHNDSKVSKLWTDLSLNGKAKGIKGASNIN